jgi:hypothetical protein
MLKIKPSLINDEGLKVKAFGKGAEKSLIHKN